MSTSLGPLYHWSPRERLSSIRRLGLMPGKKNFAGYGSYENSVTGKTEEFRASYVCFSTTPATAWSYSHAVWKTEGTFDLWEVYLTEEDEVHINPMWGDRIVEVRVHNRIPKRRLIWVGERTV